jgi:hypothetical protein
MLMNSIVLARYSEDLRWIVEIPDDWEIFIYNKGEPISDDLVIARADHIIERPNIGRESETYFHHMLTVKGNPRHYTVYAQAEPFTHSPDFLALLDCWREWEDVQPLSWEWRADKDVPPRHLLEQTASATPGRLRVRPELFSLTKFGAVEYEDPGPTNMGLIYRFLQGLPDGTNIAGHLFRKCGLDSLADSADEHMIGTFAYGAIFAVRNYRVANTSQESLRLLREFAVAPVTVHGYILERMWLHLFGAEFLRRIAPLGNRSAVAHVLREAS